MVLSPGRRSSPLSITWVAAVAAARAPSTTPLRRIPRGRLRPLHTHVAGRLRHCLPYRRRSSRKHHSPSEVQSTRYMRYVYSATASSREHRPCSYRSVYIHDACNPNVLRQLRERQPLRSRAVMEEAPEPTQGSLPNVDLRERFSHARRRRGSGLTGGRGEYLRALAIRHVDPRAASAVDRFSSFATPSPLPASSHPGSTSLGAHLVSCLFAARRRAAAQLHRCHLPRPIAVGEASLDAPSRERSATLQLNITDASSTRSRWQ